MSINLFVFLSAEDPGVRIYLVYLDLAAILDLQASRSLSSASITADDDDDVVPSDEATHRGCDAEETLKDPSSVEPVGDIMSIVGVAEDDT